MLPVMKHIPGHGRAMVDSHHDLPVVTASLDELDAQDFAPFRALKDEVMAMSAHLVFTAVDPERPATTSPKVIQESSAAGSASRTASVGRQFDERLEGYTR